MDAATDIYRRLGPEYQEGDEVLKVVALATAAPIDRVEDALDSLTVNLTADGAPSAWLPWLTERLGWKVPPRWPDHVLRSVVRNAARWRQDYGLPSVIEEIVYEYTRPTATGHGISIQLIPAEPAPGGLRVGAWRVGAGRVEAGVSEHAIFVRITDLGGKVLDAAAIARVRSLLEDLLPAWNLFYVLVPPTTGGWRVGAGRTGKARIGFQDLRTA